MSSLNLLPPREQKEIGYLISWQALKIIAAMVVAVLIIILFFFIGTNVITQKYSESISAPDQLTKILNAKTTAPDYNQELQALANIQNDSLSWSQILISLSGAMPANVYVTDIDLDYKKNTFKIEGIAPDRQTSLILIKDLENIPWLKDINAPLTNLLARSNIKFSITATIDSAKLPRL